MPRGDKAYGDGFVASPRTGPSWKTILLVILFCGAAWWAWRSGQTKELPPRRAPGSLYEAEEIPITEGSDEVPSAGTGSTVGAGGPVARAAATPGGGAGEAPSNSVAATAAQAPPLSGPEGQVLEANTAAVVEIVDGRAVVTGEIYATGSALEMLEAVIDIEIFSDGRSIDSTSLPVVVAPGAPPTPWEVGFIVEDIPFEDLRVESTITQR